MTQDEIISMAREAGIGSLSDYGKEALERFAALVAYEVGIAQYNNGYEAGQRNEREACAKVGDEHPTWTGRMCAAPAARQALDALENAYENGFLTGITGLKTIDIITALREALAEQAEQKPVGYVDEALRIKWLIDYDAVSKLTGHKLYAAPVRTKDLTDDDIFKTNKTELPDCQDLVDFARAVIAADREKNK